MQNINAPEKRVSFDFSRLKKPPFDIKPDSSFNANLSNGSFQIALKKSNCIAWVDIPKIEYHDHVIDAKIRLDSLGGYTAAGIAFHILDSSIYGGSVYDSDIYVDDETLHNVPIPNELSYYLALVSNKGYFRLDAVENNKPRTVLAWTEIPTPIHSEPDNNNFNLKIITHGTNHIFLVNNNWIGEINDSSIEFGRLGFAAASYSENEEKQTEDCGIVCKAYLDYISIETRPKKIEEEWKIWTDDFNINAERRLRLAETYAVMNEPSKALEQINRAWKRRDVAVHSIAATFTEVRTKKELLLAARMYFNLGQFDKAEMFVDQIIEQEPNITKHLCSEKKLAYTEKLRILNEANRFDELKQFILKNSSKIPKDIHLYTLTARCYWELNEYNESALAWEKAFKTNRKNGVYAVNAASAHELAGSKKEALKLYIESAEIFLDQNNAAELTALLPKLINLGGRNKNARTLAAKITETYAVSGVPSR
ncbi:MAG: hypothetical protein FWC97_04670 [Treponema sp.]|nr:hypothetical protein [Treponema sp.]